MTHIIQFSGKNGKNQMALRAISLIRNNVRLILTFLDVLNRGREGGRGYFTVLIKSLADARESTLLAFYAFTSRVSDLSEKAVKSLLQRAKKKPVK